MLCMGSRVFFLYKYATYLCYIVLEILVVVFLLRVEYVLADRQKLFCVFNVQLN